MLPFPTPNQSQILSVSQKQPRQTEGSAIEAKEGPHPSWSPPSSTSVKPTSLSAVSVTFSREGLGRRRGVRQTEPLPPARKLAQGWSMQSSSSRSYGEATAEAGAAAKLRHVVLGGQNRKRCSTRPWSRAAEFWRQEKKEGCQENPEHLGLGTLSFPYPPGPLQSLHRFGDLVPLPTCISYRQHQGHGQNGLL